MTMTPEQVRDAAVSLAGRAEREIDSPYSSEKDVARSEAFSSVADVFARIYAADVASQAIP